MRSFLLEARLDCNMTQDEVSTKAKISRSYYTHIEKGSKTPSVEISKRLASILKFDWTLFFDS